MTTLREAATQALEAMEGGADSWQLVGPAIDALKAALVEDAMQKFTDVSQEIEAALAEPVQEPVAYAVGRTLHWHESKGVNDAQLYLSTPQRKPLTEEEIQAAWDSVDMRHPRGNETRIAFARAIERAHGIK